MSNIREYMKIDLHPNEKLVREGGANLQRGVEAVGGRLFLTDQRLFFHSHSFNVQTGATEIPLSEIKGMELRWTKFLGAIPVFPNTLAVMTAGGEEHRFVVYGRKRWAAAIRAQQQTAAT
jgi:hypothetical protein